MGLPSSTHYPSEFTLSRVKCHKILIDLPSNLFTGITTLNYTIITLALVSYLRSLVVRALHRHRKGVGSITAGGPIVDEFFSTVPGWFFDMCTIQLEPKTHYPSEFTLSRVKCHKILIDLPLRSISFGVRHNKTRPKMCLGTSDIHVFVESAICLNRGSLLCFALLSLHEVIH